MAASVPNPAHNTTLSHYSGIAVNGSFVAIGLIVSIDGPGREVGTRDTTVLTSSVETCAPTIVHNGEVSGKLLWDPKSTDQLPLETAIGTPSLDSWKITLADNAATTGSFSGVLTGFAPTGIEVESNLESTFKIKVSGAITWV